MGGSYSCRYCEKAFSHAPAHIQHERACAAASGRQGGANGAEEEAASRSRSKRKRYDNDIGDDDAKLAEELANDALDQEWDDEDEENDGTMSPTGHAPFAKQDPNKPLPVWAADPDSEIITEVRPPSRAPPRVPFHAPAPFVSPVLLRAPFCSCGPFFGPEVRLWSCAAPRRGGAHYRAPRLHAASPAAACARRACRSHSGAVPSPCLVSLALASDAARISAAP